MKLVVGRWFEAEAVIDGNTIKGIKPVLGPRGAEAFFLGDGLYVKAGVEILDKEKKESLPIIQTKNSIEIYKELPDVLSVDNVPYILREVIKKPSEIEIIDMEEVIPSIEIPETPRAVETDEIEDLVSQFLQKKEEISIQNSGDTFEQYKKLIEDYQQQLPEYIMDVLKRLVSSEKRVSDVEKAYDFLFQQKEVILLNYEELNRKIKVADTLEERITILGGRLEQSLKLYQELMLLTRSVEDNYQRLVQKFERILENLIK